MTHLSSSTTEKDNQPPLVLEEALEWLREREVDGCLQIINNSVIYFVHVIQGKLFYATNSLAPFERLERHLRRLGNQNSQLTNEVIKQGREKFRNDLEQYTQLPSDYQSIIWLLEAKKIEQQEAVTLIRRISREVFESLLNLSNLANRKFIYRENYDLIILLRLDPITFFQQCQKRVQAWQVFNPEIWSSYQRPYLATQTNNIAGLTPEQNQTICKLLKGLNFRQISALIDKDDLIVAKIIYPSILNKTIILRPPKSPFDRLPVIKKNSSYENEIEDWEIEVSKIYSVYEDREESRVTKWKIVCVDHQIENQQKINSFLENKELFNLVMISESLNAFAKILEFQPQLIFLNVDLPELNGYELCSLLRGHQDFKNTPIVMISNNQSLINLTKSKLIGATSYLVRPFTKSDLFNIVYKYLT